MSRHIRFSALVAVVLLTVAMSATSAAAANHARPFLGITIGQDSAGAPLCPGASLQYLSSGTGQVAHLGRVTFEVSHCTWFDPVSMSGTFGPGTITFTAANGDRLILADSGKFAFNADASLSIIDLHWSAIGGTGRFESAGGAGGGAGFSDLIGGTTTMAFWGSISY